MGEIMVKGGIVRIHACAECGSAFLAVPAAAVGDVEWHHDAVSFLEKRNAGPGLDYDAHVLMSYITSQSLAWFLLHVD
jgi:hypothetical protein